MIPIVIGFLSGLLVILVVFLLKKLHQPTIYSLILSGIGFIYVGFAWSDTGTLIVNFLQALFFLIVAAYGLKKGLYYLAAGYFLHGIWDLVYSLFPSSNLAPPHYDLFCLSIDFTIGIYLVFINYKNIKYG